MADLLARGHVMDTTAGATRSTASTMAVRRLASSARSWAGSRAGQRQLESRRPHPPRRRSAPARASTGRCELAASRHAASPCAVSERIRRILGGHEDTGPGAAPADWSRRCPRRASSAAMSSTGRRPRPMSTMVPTSMRTMWWRNRSAATWKLNPVPSSRGSPFRAPQRAAVVRLRLALAPRRRGSRARPPAPAAARAHARSASSGRPSAHS